MEKVKPGDKPKQVDNIVITCMDFRYHESIRDLLKDEHDVNIDQADQLSIGGSSTGIVDGSLMPSIQIAYDSHHTRNLYMFDHIDCGGFGSLKAFDNDAQKEAQAHFESIDKAQGIISKVMPEMVLVTYLMGLDGKPVER